MTAAALYTIQNHNVRYLVVVRNDNDDDDDTGGTTIQADVHQGKQLKKTMAVVTVACMMVNEKKGRDGNDTVGPTQRNPTEQNNNEVDDDAGSFVLLALRGVCRCEGISVTKTPHSSFSSPAQHARRTFHLENHRCCGSQQSLASAETHKMARTASLVRETRVDGVLCPSFKWYERKRRARS